MNSTFYEFITPVGRQTVKLTIIAAPGFSSLTFIRTLYKEMYSDKFLKIDGVVKSPISYQTDWGYDRLTCAHP